MPHRSADSLTVAQFIMHSMYFIHISRGLRVPEAIVQVFATKDFPQSLQQNFWIPSLRLPFRTTFSLPHMGHTLPLLKRCSSI